MSTGPALHQITQNNVIKQTNIRISKHLYVNNPKIKPFNTIKYLAIMMNKRLTMHVQVNMLLQNSNAVFISIIRGRDQGTPC